MSTIRFVDFPVALFEAFDEVTEGLLREYMMVVQDAAHPFTVADVATARDVKASLTTALGREATASTVLLELTPHDAAGFQVMQAVLEHANSLAAEEKLLAFPVLPELVAFRNWVCAEIAAQSNGASPSPWRLPESYEAVAVDGSPWPGTAQLPPDAAWLVGDDSNRIVAASPAALQMLGWDCLVGQRILAVIPPRFRERHIVGFTRGVALGDHRLLDRPLPLEALTSDGQEIPIALTLSRHDTPTGRVMFVASLARRRPDIPAPPECP